MPEHHPASVSGTVTAVFAHRFVIESKDTKYLADIGPDAVKLVELKEGDKVSVTGERKPSEIKVTEIVKAGGKPIRIAHKKKKHDHDEPHPIGIRRQRSKPSRAKASRSLPNRAGSQNISRFWGAPPREKPSNFMPNWTERSASASRPISTNRNGSPLLPPNSATPSTTDQSEADDSN
jgi:hypothetical protein